nr:P-type conjugative transfer protein TrbJ [Hankyongella ginsenosidimutans]
MKLRRLRAVRLAAALLTAPVTVALILATPAHAIIVFDPTNYAQNVLQAARALQQINQQITQLQNEAQMLINQARNLASLPYSSLQQLQQSVQRTQQLLSQAQNIAYNVQQIDQAFSQNTPTSRSPRRTRSSSPTPDRAGRTRWAVCRTP